MKSHVLCHTHLGLPHAWIFFLCFPFPNCSRLQRWIWWLGAFCWSMLGSMDAEPRPVPTQYLQRQNFWCEVSLFYFDGTVNYDAILWKANDIIEIPLLSQQGHYVMYCPHDAMCFYDVKHFELPGCWNVLHK